jgi:hypothetical protein
VHVGITGGVLAQAQAGGNPLGRACQALDRELNSRSRALHRNPQGRPRRPVFIAEPAQALPCFSKIRNRCIQAEAPVGEMHQQQRAGQMAAPNHALEGRQKLGHQRLIGFFRPTCGPEQQLLHEGLIGHAKPS